MAKDEEANEEGQQGEEKKSGKMKLIIIAVVALALLGGGGFFAYTKFFVKHEDTAAPAPKAAAPVSVVYALDPFLVNLADPAGKRYLKVTMELVLENQAVQDEMKEHQNAVKDTMLMLLSGKVFDDVASPAGKTALKREIVTKMNRQLTKGQVKEVFFTDFLVQ